MLQDSARHNDRLGVVQEAKSSARIVKETEREQDRAHISIANEGRQQNTTGGEGRHVEPVDAALNQKCACGMQSSRRGREIVSGSGAQQLTAGKLRGDREI